MYFSSYMYTYMYTYMYCLHRYSFLVVHQPSFWCTAISGRIIITNWSLKLKVIQLTQPFTWCIQKFQHKKINACDYAWALPKLHVHSTLLYSLCIICLKIRDYQYSHSRVKSAESIRWIHMVIQVVNERSKQSHTILCRTFTRHQKDWCSLWNTIIRGERSSFIPWT